MIGCGTSGEPLTGDVALQYGTSMPKLVVGSAVTSADFPSMMLVQLGTDNVDCSTVLETGGFNPPQGTFVFFDAAEVVSGPNAMTEINVSVQSSTNISIDAGTGTVTIAAIDTRVSGSIDFTYTDDTVGTISVTGSFDVKRCF